MGAVAGTPPGPRGHDPLVEVMKMLTLQFRTMGSQARAFLAAEGEGARTALERLPAWFASREHLLSRFEPGSALARLNERGSGARLDDVLWEAIDVALAAAEATGGLVTPTILAALEAAGYDRSFVDVARDQRGRLAGARAAPDWRAIERDPATQSIGLPRGVRLDLGGTAKGWCADAAAASLARLGPALVDVGGDIAAAGTPAEPWPIAVADPRGDAAPLALVGLRGGGIATSGRDFRRWKRAGVEHHHLIDPRTGAPARTDVWTATVLGPSALVAEIAAKRVLLEGSRAGLDWIATRPELSALVVREDGVVLQSTRFVSHVLEEAA